MEDVWTEVLARLSIADMGRLGSVSLFHRDHTNLDWHWRRVQPPDKVRQAYKSAKKQTAATLYHGTKPVQDVQWYYNQRREQYREYAKYLWWVRQKQQKVSRSLLLQPWSLVVMDLRRYHSRVEAAHAAIVGYDRAIVRKRVFESYLPDYWALIGTG